MKLLIDMNLSLRWVTMFEDAGVAAVHWSAIGDANAPDTEIMIYAATYGRIVLTSDLDFGTILAVTKKAGPSVIQLRAEDLRPEAAGPVVLAAAQQCRDEIEEGVLLTVDASRFRLTLLPLQR